MECATSSSAFLFILLIVIVSKALYHIKAHNLCVISGIHRPNVKPTTHKDGSLAVNLMGNLTKLDDIWTRENNLRNIYSYIYLFWLP